MKAHDRTGFDQYLFPGSDGLTFFIKLPLGHLPWRVASLSTQQSDNPDENKVNGHNIIQESWYDENQYSCN
jgi:hypothetical protein